jgi:hypothetical protein
MSAPDMPAIRWITIRGGEDFLAVRCGRESALWVTLGGVWHHERDVTDHGVVIPAGPVDRLVQLPDVGEAERDALGGEWRTGSGMHIRSGDSTVRDVRVSYESTLKYAARLLAVARAIDAEKAKPTARERLLARLDARAEEGHEYLEWPVSDLRAALAEL